MWWWTIGLGVLAVPSAVVLGSRRLRAQRGVRREGSGIERLLERLTRAAAVRVVRIAACASVVGFGGVAVANFVAENRLSWGLAVNWAFWLAFAGAIGLGLWVAWGRFRWPDWRTVWVCVAVAVGVWWAVLVVLVSLPPNGSGDRLNPFESAAVVTMLAWMWVPFMALPSGLFLGLVVALLRHRRSAS